ncbi:Hypothetical protein Minf_1060 [Methylacidiphilum infernorum V4]|uniref:Uncharacterized protein n=1 Tax=Methylacidiphilum infernorum (isolate V4) TaxID=481448 RepID=B3DUW2_METI4|nr:Hypothetical protein Minf_1060 [Methylacidiphilum infernorum V4]
MGESVIISNKKNRCPVNGEGIFRGREKAVVLPTHRKFEGPFLLLDQDPSAFKNVRTYTHRFLPALMGLTDHIRSLGGLDFPG